MALEYADLHIHSYYSDSDLSLEDIFKQAASANLRGISITDHDTVAGLEKATELGLAYNIDFLGGIEFSTEMHDSEIHILGYLMDFHDKALNNILNEIKGIRKERLLKMAAKLNNLGIEIDSDELFNKINKASPTRLHLALYMMEKKYISYAGEAFRKYISIGKPGYVSRFRYSVEKMIKIIKDTGGIAFLAHPHILSDLGWIKNFRDWGLDGMEVIYPGYSFKRIEQYKQLADNYGLLKGGGSDSHGNYKAFTSIGKIKIPYIWLENIKRYSHISQHNKRIARNI